MKTAFRPIRLRALPALLAARLLVGGACSPLSAQTTVNWNGGTGNWNDASLWSTGSVPDDPYNDVYIDGGKTGTASVVTFSSNYRIGRLTVDAGDTFNVADGATFGIYNGSFNGSGYIVNNGTVNLNGAGTGATLVFNGPGSFLGSNGAINLNGPNDRVLAKYAGDQITITGNQTFSGRGNLGGGNSTIVNNGVIQANVNGGTLTVQPGGGTANLSNYSLMQATNGGTLALSNVSGGRFANNYNFRVYDGSTLTVSPGALTNFFNNTLTGGNYDVIASANSTATLSLGGGSIVTNHAYVTLYGAGSVFNEFNALATNASDALLYLNNGRNFTTAGALTNAGVISVGGGIVNGGTLTVSGALNNSGTLQLIASSNAVVQGNAVNTGQLSVNQGSTFAVQGTLTISGRAQAGFGVQNGYPPEFISATGALTQTTSGVLAGGTFTAPTLSLAGSLRPGGSFYGNGSVQSYVGTMTLNGQVLLLSDAALVYDLAGTTTSDRIAVTGMLTLDGTLTVNAMAGFGAGRYDLIDYTGTLTDNGLNLGTLPSGYNYAIDTSIAGQVDLVVTNAVPEPSAWAAVLVGIGSLAWVQRRRARAA